MNTIIKVGLAAAILTFSFSCKESFLDLHSEIATDARDAIVDINSMEYALTGVYGLMQNTNYYNRNMPLIPDIVSDNVYLSRVNSSRYTGIDRLETTVTDGYASGTWNRIYRVIANCNLIIQAGEALDLPDDDLEEENAIIGQCYAIRALAHFDLCRLYAQPYNYTSDASHPGIPLVLKSSINVDEVPDARRNTVKEVYDAIVNDLKTAMSLLPPDNTLPGAPSSYKGKITFYAAEALLSRVYLYMGDWGHCEEMATDVIDSKKYTLLATNELVSEFPESQNEESIFEIINTSVDSDGGDAIGYFYNQSGYGDALPTLDVYNIYSITDVRRSFMTIGDRKGSGGEKGVPILERKYTKGEGRYQDIIVIRLAEVYLNRAEARAHLGLTNSAKIGESIADLKVIAGRADVNFVVPPGLSSGGQALIDRILLERRKELAFEGQRLFDLTRNKLSFWKFHSLTDSVRVDYPNNMTILPIPLREMDIPNNEMEQNPGYGR